MTAGAEAGQDGFSLPAEPDAVLDVLFDDQRIFSVAPTVFSSRGGRFHAAWPPVLAPHLTGSTRVVVKEHLSGKVLLDEPVRFDDSADRTRVRDRQGRPVAVDKFGFLVRMFTDADQGTAQHLASSAARLVHDINAFGVAGFLAYGSLLGAVRNGHLIGHDTDVDTAYVSNYDHPADIARESFALERFLVGLGWEMARMRIGLIRAVFPDLAGDTRHIDIFTAVHDGTRLYVNPFVSAEMPRSAVVPLGEVTFEGVQVPAPAEPGAVLEAMYGPSYIVPDPSFAYDPPRWLKRQSNAGYGNYRLRRALWQQRLKGQWKDGRPAASGFAREVSAQEGRDATIVDVGCGSGSDAVWFAESGHRVIGIDYVVGPLTRLTGLARRRDLPAEFRTVSLYDLRATVAAGAQLAGEPAEDLVLYAKDLLDVIEPEGRTNFWLLARTALLRRGRLHLRFRTRGNRAGLKEPGFRALDPDVIEAEALARGAHVLSRKDGHRATVMVLTWR